MTNTAPKFSISSLLSAGLLASGLLLTGCASGPEVKANAAQGTDFASYKTFGFASPLGTDKGGYQSIVSQYLKAASQRELEARGLKYEPNAPQLLINFNAALNDKLMVTSMPTMGVGMSRSYYGYRSGMYSTWPMYQDQVSSYKEGTLNVDLIDAARKQMVWEAVVTDSVTQKDVEQLKQAIDIAVAAAFAKFPLAATAPMPVQAK